jgi:hypothetical protein
MAVWTELKPASSDIPNDELPSVLTGQAIVLRTAIEKHSFWTDSSGVSAGIMRLSEGSYGPGAARAFFDVASNLSNTVHATKPLGGRFYITSDTSRFYSFTTSGVTTQLGSTRAIVYQTPALNTDERVLVQIGSAAGSGSVATVAFSTSYSVPPVMQLTPLISASSLSISIAELTTSGTTNFSFRVKNVWGLGNACNVLWRSHGTVAL